MQYAIYSAVELNTYPVCMLVPKIDKEIIKREYIDAGNINPDQVIAVDLFQDPNSKKTGMKLMRQYITDELVPVFKDLGTEYIFVADGDYFKALTKLTKVEAYIGYVADCAFHTAKVIYIPNFKTIFFDPDAIRAKINQALTGFNSHRSGCYIEPGDGIIKFAAYPTSTPEIGMWLKKLLDMNKPLAIDIETFSLKHHLAGIGTISFAWSAHEGIAFPVDYESLTDTEAGTYGIQRTNNPVRSLLKNFFREYMQRAMYHNISFDVYVLIYQLFMDDILDTEGLLDGLDTMLRNWDCTKLITYLATNSCAGNELSLKQQAQEFAGNYALEDIKDIRRIPLSDLLEYNLVDALSTWHVYDKHRDTVIKDQQEDLYQNLFKPAIADIIQMQLTGLPMNMDKVKACKTFFLQDQNDSIHRMKQTNALGSFTYRLNEMWVEKRNSELKVKRVTLSDANEDFNPRSAPQLQELLFNHLGLPILGYTKGKQPETGGETIEALKNHTTNPDILALLDALVDYKMVEKLLSSFIPAFENAAPAPDGWHYLFGNFNLGGTLSGRLSSSDPNLQNLPASKSNGRMKLYVKMIKECFEAPAGWLLAGLDFDSLEDKISALTTKDKNKLKVYTDGYDGHCLRAYAYFGDMMPDIDPLVVTSINSIATKYKTYRQDSKVPTFLLTYDGTYKGMMEQCGFSIEKAKSIEERYHELYVESDQWKEAKLNQATKDGYVTVAFGLRVRTPLLKQVIRGNSKTPYQATAEGRSAGNALGQSWCLLNTRAGVEFNAKVRKSKYRLDIRPCAHIHDAQYFIIREDLGAVAYANEHLVKAVQWQDHPDIAHDQVKLGGQLSIFYPNWSKEISIPNGANENDILDIVQKATAA